jgi:hypothetical protein
MLEQEKKGIGKRIVDIGKLVDIFEAQEGELYHIIGKTGNGKTYEGTRRAYEYLKSGYVVYTTWHLEIPDVYDERENISQIIQNIFCFWRKNFYRFDFKKNWVYLDIDRPDLVQFLATLTDCVVFLDEGQDVFDSRSRIGKTERKTITRTRHLHKTLIIISQRAQAVEVSARANITYFYKCVKGWVWYWPFKTYFRIYRTEEMDNNNLPVWEDRLADFEAELWKKHFASQKIYNMFNSWYLRAGVKKSQVVNFEAYELSIFDKFKALFKAFVKGRMRKTNTISRKVKEATEVERKNKSIEENKIIQKSIRQVVIPKTRQLKVKDVQFMNEIPKIKDNTNISSSY